MKITGNDVRQVRDALTLTKAEFSRLTFVHYATVHRWEEAGADRTPICGLPESIITVLLDRLGEVAQLRELGARIRKALIVGGPLSANSMLLLWLTGQRPPDPQE